MPQSPSKSSASDPQERRALVLLSMGAAAGLLLAAIGVLSPTAGSDSELPERAVASVNGQLILRSNYARLLAGLESDSRNPIDDAARRHVLDRMIEEELLVQRALELGLVQLDRRVRADLTSSLIASVVSSIEGQSAEPDELREFYLEYKDYFTQPGRYRVGQVFLRIAGEEADANTLARAKRAHEALSRGDDYAEVQQRLGDDPVAPVPNTLLPALKLREYVGPTALARVLELNPGEVSKPIHTGSGIHIMELLELQPARTPPLEQIEAQVRSEWRRRSGDRTLRTYLDELRSGSQVLTAESL